VTRVDPNAPRMPRACIGLTGERFDRKHPLRGTPRQPWLVDHPSRILRPVGAGRR
jgi:hypothetical protein